jgi:5-amino-6-(5-phospho-D-ribitylamino)uracil phosphatase
MINRMIMKEPTIQLVAIDLDGTLLNDDKRVTDQTVNALRCMAGAKIVIASARPPRSVRHIYRQLNLDTLQINYNGALVWSEPQRKVFFHRPITAPLAAEIIDFARDMYDEVLVSCEILDKWYTDRNDFTYNTETGKLFPADVIAPLAEWYNGEITKLMFLGEPRITLQLEAMIAKKFGDRISVLRTDRDLIQIMDNRVSKATSLKLVADHYGIAMENVLAIGDAPNDVAMIQSAGIGVAMDNAHPLVKEHADWVAPSNNDHGVHAALVRYGLCPV